MHATVLVLLCGLGVAWAQVKECNSLVADLGLDVAVTPIDSMVDWSPRFAGRAGESELVFVVTRKQSLYISTDDGVHWDGPINGADGRMPPRTIGGATNVTGIHFTSMPASQFYTTGDDNGAPFYWTTTDGGKSFKVHKNDEQVMWIVPHRSLASVAIGFSYTATYQLSWLTTDFGATWAQVGDNTTFMTRFACTQRDCQHDDALLFQSSTGEWDDCGAGNCQLIKQAFDANKPSAQALGVRTQVFAHSNGLTEVHWPWYDPTAPRVLFASTRTTEPGSSDVEVKIYYSHDMANTWTLAQFPFGTQPHHFRFIPTSTDVLLAGVRSVAAGADADYGSLYVSSDGLEEGLFVESLRYVRFSPKRWWEESMFAGNLDVERAAELEGVLLANRYRANADGSPDLDCLQTVLTLDFGATWNLLAPPAGTNACAGGAACHLHVALDPTQFPTAYSPSDAVGLWLAQGNVGECLAPTPSATYMSADGGSSWVVMANERLIYEVSNHGALVAGAATERMTNELVYTLDDGVTFNRCAFRKVNMSVNNILTRSFNARNFIMEGRNDMDRDSYGLLVHFDFNDAHERECTPADYVSWSPGDCLLGRHVVWQRRKIDAMCHNPTEHEAMADEYACKCTDKDYECDFCYEFIGGKCVAETTSTCKLLQENPSLECVRENVTSYTVSDGYRLQPNNKCSGGVTHGSVEPCPVNVQSPAANNTTAIVLAIMAVGVVIAVILGVTLYVYMKRRKAAQSYGTLAESDDEL